MPIVFLFFPGDYFWGGSCGLLGIAAFRKEGGYGALRSRNWRNMEGRRDHFRGIGKLECQIDLGFTTRERLQPKTCVAALLPEICHM